MICCLNPECEQPLNPNHYAYCKQCGAALVVDLFNRFRIKKPMGQGGFGRTDLAADLHNFEEECIVKQLIYSAQSSLANRKVVELFVREAKQLQQLRKNPQIPDLLAYFESQGYLYLVQELIDGENLETELLKQGVFSEQKIRELLLGVLPVLSFIHRQGVIHRDLKPSNIMRRRDTGELVLIDFGISKQQSQKLTTLMGVTTVGTQGYAPYEQLNQEGAQPEPASDLFSLGATCFHLMTGTLPSDLWLRRGYSWCEDWEQHLSIPLSTNLTEILNKLLKFEARDRYQTAEEVLAALYTGKTHPAGKTHLEESDLAESFHPASPTSVTELIPKKQTHKESTQLEPNPPPQKHPAPPIQSKTPPSPNLPNTPPTSKRLTTRRSFLTLLGLGSVGLGSAFLWQELSNPDQPVLKVGGLELYPFNFTTIRLNKRGKVIARNPGRVHVYEENLGNDLMLEMVAIPGGTFTMGAPSTEKQGTDDEKPRHPVTIQPFLIGKFQITQTQYKAIMGNNPSNFTNQGTTRPVEQVTWHEAVEFCEKLSQQSGKIYRLPSEAEWEYACRAGSNTPFSFGETITAQYANFDGTSTYAFAPKSEYRKQTTPVGSFLPNSFGLFDMHGNVYEWCQDIWHDSYHNAPSDGSAWLDGDPSRRVLRGGSWYSKPWNCRSAIRYWFSPSVRLNFYGFRVVLSLPRSAFPASLI